MFFLITEHNYFRTAIMAALISNYRRRFACEQPKESKSPLYFPSYSETKSIEVLPSSVFVLFTEGDNFIPRLTVAPSS